MFNFDDREEDDLLGVVINKTTNNTELDFLGEYLIEDDCVYGQDDFEKIYNPYDWVDYREEEEAW